MLTIYVGPRYQDLLTADEHQVTVKEIVVREKRDFIDLQDYEPSRELRDVEIVLRNGLYGRRLSLPPELKDAIVHFLRKYHAKQNTSFDCYAFVNMVKGVEAHKVYCMHGFWKVTPKPRHVPVGSVIFLCSETHFYHAAVYIGFGLYISVYGAGGDLEVATLKDMKRDSRATMVYFAQPLS